MGKNFRCEGHVSSSMLLLHFGSHPIRHVHCFELDSFLILLDVIYTLDVFQRCIGCSFNKQTSHSVLDRIRLLYWINIEPCIILYCQLRLFIKALLYLIEQIGIIITWLTIKFLY